MSHFSVILEYRLLGRVCKLRPGRGYTGLSPMSRTTRLAEEPANRLRDRTKAGPLQRSRTLQTRPRRSPVALSGVIPSPKADGAREQLRPTPVRAVAGLYT